MSGSFAGLTIKICLYVAKKNPSKPQSTLDYTSPSGSTMSSGEVETRVELDCKLHFPSCDGNSYNFNIVKTTITTVKYIYFTIILVYCVNLVIQRVTRSWQACSKWPA